MDTKAPVLLTDAIHPDGAAILAEHARLIVAPDHEPDTLRRIVREVEGIVVRAGLPDDIFEHSPRIKGVVRHGVGLDGIPVAAATARGIVVANVPGMNTNAVAEYVFAALLNLRRSLPGIDAHFRSAGWDDARRAGVALSEIAGTTLGVVGLGAIGRRVVGMARHGFGMRVLTSSISGQKADGAEPVTLDELFRASDAVVLACALTPQTRGLVDQRLIGLMKRNAVLVNVARGPVVVTAALIDALREGRIAGAALDVHDTQPVLAEHIPDVPNLILTPHLAGITATSSRAMSIGAAQEMVRMLRGEPPLNPVNLPFATV